MSDNLRQHELTPVERKTRIAEFEQHYGITSQEFLEQIDCWLDLDLAVMSEWLILLDRGDLV